MKRRSGLAGSRTPVRMCMIFLSTSLVSIKYSIKDFNQDKIVSNYRLKVFERRIVKHHLKAIICDDLVRLDSDIE